MELELPLAVQLCNGKIPIFGKYEFESTEPVSKNNGQTMFTFTQRVTCSDEDYSSPTRVKFDLSQEQEKLLSEQARKYTSIYLSAKNQGKYNDAYKMLTPGNKSISSFGEWKAREEEYQAVTGDFINRNIWKTTVYDNPENSSQPGIYIAVDYESKFQNVPLHCGYVIWFINEPGSTDFKVMREEHGYIDSKIYNKISEQELKDIKSKFKCDPS